MNLTTIQTINTDILRMLDVIKETKKEQSRIMFDVLPDSPFQQKWQNEVERLSTQIETSENFMITQYRKLHSDIKTPKSFTERIQLIKQIEMTYLE
jgi:hypothetical protein